MSSAIGIMEPIAYAQLRTGNSAEKKVFHDGTTYISLTYPAQELKVSVGFVLGSLVFAHLSFFLLWDIYRRQPSHPTTFRRLANLKVKKLFFRDERDTWVEDKFSVTFDKQLEKNISSTVSMSCVNSSFSLHFLLLFFSQQLFSHDAKLRVFLAIRDLMANHVWSQGLSTIYS